MTDTIIQSHITSPLVRIMQSIPTNSDTYTHGIPDNVPPFSKNKIRIEPDTYDLTSLQKSLNSIQVFKLPRMGHLRRLSMLYRMQGRGEGTTTMTNTKMIPTPFQFADGIEYIELRTKSNVIQRIYSDVIPFEQSSMCTNNVQLKRFMNKMKGYVASNDNSDTPLEINPFVYRINRILKDTSQAIATNQDVIRFSSMDFLVPIPLSSTFYMKDNFDTNFVEELEVWVKTQTHPNQKTYSLNPEAQNNDLRHVISLFAEYHHFHEDVEQVIRNTNFKPNVPACLLQSEYMKYTSPAVTLLPANSKLFIFDIRSDALITDLFVIPMSTNFHKTMNAQTYRTYDTRIHYSTFEYSVYFRLKSGNEIILEGYKAEFDSIASAHYSTSRRQFQTEGMLDGDDEEYGTRIRLGLNNTDEYFNGGISLASLVNPTFEIEITPIAGNSTTNIEFDLILKRKVLLRIDSNTGYIEKSLQS